jgi:sugar lactone lactonase YvrE
VVTRGLDVVLLDEYTCNVTRVLTRVEDDKPGNRFNDGKADPRGRLWAGNYNHKYILCHI